MDIAVSHWGLHMDITVSDWGLRYYNRAGNFHLRILSQFSEGGLSLEVCFWFLVT